MAPRTTSYARLTDVVLAVADARPDHATERFDAELAAAVAEGRLDATTARTLRWWQRESIRGFRSYLDEVLPTVLDALAAGAAGSAASAAEAAVAWSAARGLGHDTALARALVAAFEKRRSRACAPRRRSLGSRRGAANPVAAWR